MKSARLDQFFCVVLLCFAAIVASQFFLAYAFDDSFIGFSIADNLQRGLGFTFDPGVKTLSTSAPLAPLIYAALARLFHVDITSIAQFIALVSYLTLGPLAYGIIRNWSKPTGAFFAALSLLTSPFIVTLWSHETLLELTACSIAVLTLLKRRFALAGFLFGCALLLRQEAIIPMAVSLVATFRTRGLQKASMLFTFAMLPMMAWAAYAIPTFGTIFSQTMAVKIALADKGFNTFFAGVTDYASLAFFNDFKTYQGGIAIFFIATLCAAISIAKIKVLPPFVLAVSAASALQIALYVALHVVFFVWFAVPVAVLFALSISLPWIDFPASHNTVANSKPSLSAGMLLGRATAAALLAMHFFFIVRITIGKFWPEDMIGRFPGSAYQSSTYNKLGKLLAQSIPKDASILYPEPGQLRYYSRRTIIDDQGLTHPQALANYIAGHCERTIEDLRPTYILEDERAGRGALRSFSPNHSDFSYKQFPWFLKAYTLDRSTIVLANTIYRSHFVLYRLVNASAIPANFHRS